MNKNDEYFKPGDKVVRVNDGVPSEKHHPLEGRSPPKYGKVYCVEDFWEGPCFNIVMLVGCGGWVFDCWGRKIGWRASAFRKVKECGHPSIHETQKIYL